MKENRLEFFLHQFHAFIGLQSMHTRRIVN